MGKKSEWTGYFVDPELCMKCRYGAKTPSAVKKSGACNYILETGKIRPSGNSTYSSCEAFEPRKRNSSLASRN